MLPILIVGAAGFYYLLCGYARITQFKKEMKNGEYEKISQERLMEKIGALDKGMHLAGIMASTAPLLGLLGTVTGMVATFQVITLYGNQNPVLMADGISEALITTQSGLIIAFPLVLFKQRLEEKTVHIKQHLEEGLRKFYE